MRLVRGLTLAGGHRIACHLPLDVLEAVDPVIAVKAAAH